MTTHESVNMEIDKADDAELSSEEVARLLIHFSKTASTCLKQKLSNHQASSNRSYRNSGLTNSSIKWQQLDDKPMSSTKHSLPHVDPPPRHGHRAIAYNDYMIVYGGGCGKIIDAIRVFDTSTNTWFEPQVKGEVPDGRAAFGMALEGSRILIHGGMMECQMYSADLYALYIENWEWKKLNPKKPQQMQPPCPRFGHSFTMYRGDQIFVFGGLANANVSVEIPNDGQSTNTPRYLDDLCILKFKTDTHGLWDVPITFGSPPSPRESHSAVVHTSKDGVLNKLIIYGGMGGYRLGDVHFLDCDTLMWSSPQICGKIPYARSLHSANLINNRMYVFGGWIPKTMKASIFEDGWKCTNSFACLNLETLTWEILHQDKPSTNEEFPRKRAGHSAVVFKSSIYIWSGREGYKKSAGCQVCINDMWQLRILKPQAPARLKFRSNGADFIDISWDPVPGATSYTLQCIPSNEPTTAASLCVRMMEPKYKCMESQVGQSRPTRTIPIIKTSPPVPELEYYKQALSWTCLSKR